MPLANIADYVRVSRGTALRFKDMDAADALALTLLVWLDWDAAGRGGLALDRALMRLPEGQERDEARVLAQYMAASPRYAGLKLYDFERLSRAQPATQFAALTLFDGHDAFVAYRGTDSSLAGWFEDIQLAYMEPVPSQAQAALYVERAARRFPGGLYLGGHSKGGALALYAGVNAGAAQSRIRRVYSFDGPGLSRAVFESAAYARLRDRLTVIVPPRSIVGMLLWQDGELRVVKSDARGVMQHDPFSWLTDARGLRYEAELSPASLRLREVARALLAALPEAGVRRLAESLYALVLETGARTVGELSRYMARNPQRLVSAQGDADGRALYLLMYLVAAAGGGADAAGEAEQRRALEQLTPLDEAPQGALAKA